MFWVVTPCRPVDIHSNTSQKMALFIVTFVRTQNPVTGEQIAVETEVG
jgi:hypothetical protein